MTAPKILVLAGSTREGSLNRKLARVAADTLQKLNAEFTHLDLRDFPMPIYDGDLELSHGVPERAKALKAALRNHDALVIASPEYNGSFSALLKNAIDWASRPEAPGEKPAEVFRGKTALILSASPGPGAGRRGLRHLRELLQMIGVIVVEEELGVAKAFDGFTAEGALVRPEEASRLQNLLSRLAGRVPAAA